MGHAVCSDYFATVQVISPTCCVL